MTNRRSEPRFAADQPAKVTYLDDPKAEIVNGTIVDFSASGMAILVPVDAKPSSRLRIEWPRGTVLAEVRNCRRMRPGVYRVGLAVQEIIARAEIQGQTGAA